MNTRAAHTRPAPTLDPDSGSSALGTGFPACTLAGSAGCWGRTRVRARTAGWRDPCPLGPAGHTLLRSLCTPSLRGHFRGGAALWGADTPPPPPRLNGERSRSSPPRFIPPGRAGISIPEAPRRPGGFRG